MLVCGSEVVPLHGSIRDAIHALLFPPYSIHALPLFVRLFRFCSASLVACGLRLVAAMRKRVEPLTGPPLPLSFSPSHQDSMPSDAGHTQAQNALGATPPVDKTETTGCRKRPILAYRRSDRNRRLRFPMRQQTLDSHGGF